MLWSSANPLICKLDGMTSSSGAQYRLKILAPAQLPWGTHTVKFLFIQQDNLYIYEIFFRILNDILVP